MRVERSELGKRGDRLLQVVPADLLVVGGVVVGPGLQPAREAARGARRGSASAGPDRRHPGSGCAGTGRQPARARVESAGLTSSRRVRLVEAGPGPRDAAPQGRAPPPPPGRRSGRSPRLRSSTARSAGTSRSSRAVSRARTVGGTARAVRSAARHPAAARASQQPVVDQHRHQLLDEERVARCRSTIRRRGPAARVTSPSRSLDHLGALRIAQRAERDGRRPGALLPPAGPEARAAQVGRCRGGPGRRPRPFSATWAMRSRKVGSAQWMSSITVTTGPSRAAVSSSRRAAQKVS